MNVVIEFLYDLYKSGVHYSGFGTAKSVLSGFLSLYSEGQIGISNSVFVKKLMRGGIRIILDFSHIFRTSHYALFRFYVSI